MDNTFIHINKKYFKVSSVLFMLIIVTLEITFQVLHLVVLSFMFNTGIRLDRVTLTVNTTMITTVTLTITLLTTTMMNTTTTLVIRR